MARERKPVELKLLNGNPSQESRSSLTGKNRSQTGPPNPPANLKGEAFAEWARITSYLERVGRIEFVDHAALVVYSKAWQTFCQASEAMEHHGPLVTGRDGALVKNPAHQVMRDASDTMLKYGARFGFTPKDRVNLGIQSTSSDQDDFLADFG